MVLHISTIIGEFYVRKAEEFLKSMGERGLVQTVARSEEINLLIKVGALKHYEVYKAEQEYQMSLKNN